jgi:uncharacterized radical SAM superfamily protein
MDVNVYFPGKAFPSVSITGASCKLDCGHCGGHYLEGMLNADSPEKLVNTAREIAENRGAGFLLSGGCDSAGQIDYARFLAAIQAIKSTTRLKINAHVGPLGGGQAKKLIESGVDVVSLDVVGSPKVLEDIYGIQRSMDDVMETLNAIEMDNIKTIIPHICIGLEGPSVHGELNALDLCEVLDPKKLVLISFMPTRDTEMANRPPPEKEHVIEVVREASSRYPDTEIILGCMRVRGSPEVEIEAIEAGARGIAVPAKETIAHLERAGYSIDRFMNCCALF